MKRATILIIADKEDENSYSSFSLEGEKIELHPFANAIDKIKDCTADIILIDSGFDAEKGLRLLAETKSICLNIPIIFLTYSSSDDIAIRAFKLGVRDYIKKPFKLLDLQKAIENILSLKRSSKESRQPYISRMGPFEASTKGGVSQKIKSAISYMEEKFFMDISINDLARQANLSPYYFCRKFKRQTGKSPINFLMHLRIEKAKWLLKKDLKITDVAMDVGFNDLARFSKQFKKITGLTPSEYKNSLKEK